MMYAIRITRGRAVREGWLGVAWRFEQCRHGQCPFSNRKGMLGGDHRSGLPGTAMVGMTFGASIQL
jgi:hypothetical protein